MNQRAREKCNRRAFPLTEPQRAELDRRVAADAEFPDDVVPWDEVKASVRARLDG